MRIDRALVICAVAIILTWGLGAKDDQVKIGIVDLDQAVTSTDAGRAAREELARKKREAEAEIQPLVETFQEKMKELDAKRFVLSEDVLYQKQLDMAELRNEIESKSKEAQGRLEVDRERLVGPLRTKLVEIVEEVGRDNGFSVIFQRQAPGIMYTREALDVTDLVIEKFNKQG